MQNSNMNMLASRLNGMKNPVHIGPSIGKVVKLEPFTVSIAGGSVLLTEDEELVVCEHLKDHTYKCELEITEGTASGSIAISDLSETLTGTASVGDASGAFEGTLSGSSSGEYALTDTVANQKGKIKIKREIKKNDMILVVPMEGEQMWVAVDRIGGST